MWILLKKIVGVISFGSSLIVSPKLLFSSERSRNIEKSLFNFDLEVPISCSEKSGVITEFWVQSSESVSSNLEIPNESISKPNFS